VHSQQPGQQVFRRDNRGSWPSQLPNLGNGTAPPPPLEKQKAFSGPITPSQSGSQDRHSYASPSMVINIGSVSSGQTPGARGKVCRQQRDHSGDSSTLGDCCYVISYDKDVQPTGRWHFHEPHDEENNSHYADHICNPLSRNWSQRGLESGKQHDGWDPDDNIKDAEFQISSDHDHSKLYNQEIASPANFGELWNTGNMRNHQQTEKDRIWETDIQGQSADAWGTEELHDIGGLEASNSHGYGFNQLYSTENFQLHDTDNSPVYEDDDAQSRTWKANTLEDTYDEKPDQAGRCNTCPSITGEVPSSLKTIEQNQLFHVRSILH
jgi:hypothetical protein